MGTLAKILTALAMLAFLLAVPTSFTSPFILGVTAEAFSRASTNLALLAIAVIVTFGDRAGAGRSL